MQLTARVLSRIYLLGEKSRVAEGIPASKQGLVALSSGNVLQ